MEMSLTISSLWRLKYAGLLEACTEFATKFEKFLQQQDHTPMFGVKNLEIQVMYENNSFYSVSLPEFGGYPLEILFLLKNKPGEIFIEIKVALYKNDKEDSYVILWLGKEGNPHLGLFHN